MAEFKLVIGLKSGKSVQRELKDNAAKALLGKKIGDKVSGGAIGMEGYEFELTGGSDYCGFPMRKDVQGTARKRILAIYGVGLKKKGKGIRQRKTVAGNTVHANISQINLKVLKEGKEKLDAPAKAEAKEGEKPAEEEAKEEEKPAEKKEAPKKEEKKEEKPAEKKKEEKPAEKKEEAPKEEKKKEPKREEKKEEQKK